jgi:TRAP-type C4-dicarboxylate transport system substrate-binding protein
VEEKNIINFSRVRKAFLPIAATLLTATAGWAADYTLNVNTALATSDPLYKGLEALQTNVAEASGGRLEVVLFPN